MRAHHSQAHTARVRKSERDTHKHAYRNLASIMTHGGTMEQHTKSKIQAKDDEICSDNSNDVYCRIKFKQMINFCHVFAFSSVIRAHIVERQSDFNKDLFFGSHREING